jgi:putative tryptophan/tyrosine transport system substrate-binding protein
MKAKILAYALPVLFLATIHLAEAQQATNIPQIGYLEGGPLSAHTARMEAFRQGLRELGYEEGKNIGIEWRFGDSKVDRLPALAAELVGLKVAVIVTGGTAPTRAAKEATSTIPIVMAQDNDPVASGVVASLARPGGNITGLTNFAPELSTKRLEILREVVPKLSRVAVLGSSTGPSYALVMRELELAAKVLGVKLQYLEILEPKDVETAFRAAAEGRADGVTTFASAMIVSQRAQIVELAAKNRLPGIYHNSQFSEAGGLMFYGVNVLDLDRRAAMYVDKILKGAKPADLPVEQPTKFELVINLKTAKQIALTIPPNVLARADRVIR